MLSGSYLVVSESIEGCVCRVGSCSNVRGEYEIGATQAVTQQDGALSLVDSGYRTDTPLLGGVDADNKFSVGGALQIPSYLGQGVIYSLRTGTFSVSAGVPTGMEFTVDASIIGSITDASFDCDIHASGSTRYEGP